MTKISPNSSSQTALCFLLGICLLSLLRAEATGDFQTGNADAIQQQMRWPFKESSLLAAMVRETPRSHQHRQIEQLFTEGNLSEAQKAAAVDMLKKGIEDAPERPEEAITKEGVVPGKIRETVLRVRDLAYDEALLYILSGEKTYADKAKVILLRFAEMLPQWPIYDRDGQRRPQSDTKYLQRNWMANGLWGDWYPRDLDEALPLLRAYDIIRPTLTQGEKESIERMFLYQKKFDENFDTALYGNMDSHALFALIAFGKVLEKPEYVHAAVRYWKDLLQYAYFSDGFWKESTPDYHRQITWRVKDLLPDLLEGYTDPIGYKEPSTGERFEDLDLALSNSARFKRMEDALEVLAIPDGTYISVNDAWPKTQKAVGGPSDKPGLLGATGIAKLGSQGMVAFLKYTGIRGHDHLDALNLIWFGLGRELFSETGYQPISGSSSTREWIKTTASHNTVVIDKTPHYTERKSVEVASPIPGSGFHSNPPGNVDPARGVEACMPAAARYFNQGRLLIWNAEHPDFQAMEADSPNAYPGLASLFRRTVILVPEADGEGYLVDIFRIKGGSTHDLFLRGDLGEHYTMSFDTPLNQRTDIAYGKIKLTSGASVSGRLKTVTRYDDGASVYSSMVGSGDFPADVELLCGEAPAIRRDADAPISFVRRTALQKGAPLESCFVWIHEARRAEKRIQDVKLSQHGMDTLIQIKINGRTDYIFSGISEDSSFHEDGWNFRGRLASVSVIDGQAKGVVFEGEGLYQNDKLLVDANTPIRGKVISTESKDNGGSEDAVIVKIGAIPEGNLTKAYLAHFDLGNIIRFSIPVQAAGKDGDFVRVVLKNAPGFSMVNNQVVMNGFPGWKIFDEAKVSLECDPTRPQK